MGINHSKYLFYYEPDENTKIILKKEGENFMWIVKDKKNNFISKNKVIVDIEYNCTIYIGKFNSHSQFTEIPKFRSEIELKNEGVIKYLTKKGHKHFDTYKDRIFLNYKFDKYNKKIFYIEEPPYYKRYIKYSIILNDKEKVFYVKM